VPQLSASDLTAVLLQLAATNVTAKHCKQFYDAALARAELLLPGCSLQQCADICWAFHRAEAEVPETFHEQLLACGSHWVEKAVCQEHAVGNNSVSREATHEAANFLDRLSFVGALREQHTLMIAMLDCIVQGIPQVQSESHRNQSLVSRPGGGSACCPVKRSCLPAESRAAA
jgi:hypothetical protein